MASLRLAWAAAVVLSSHAEADLEDAVTLDLGDFQAQENAESTEWVA